MSFWDTFYNQATKRLMFPHLLGQCALVISEFFTFIFTRNKDWGRENRTWVMLCLASAFSIQESVISLWKEKDFMPEAEHKSGWNAIAETIIL